VGRAGPAGKLRRKAKKKAKRRRKRKVGPLVSVASTCGDSGRVVSRQATCSLRKMKGLSKREEKDLEKRKQDLQLGSDCESPAARGSQEPAAAGDAPGHAESAPPAAESTAGEQLATSVLAGRSEQLAPVLGEGEDRDLGRQESGRKRERGRRRRREERQEGREARSMAPMPRRIGQPEPTAQPPLMSR
jgi:hypothetical protein